MTSLPNWARIKKRKQGGGKRTTTQKPAKEKRKISSIRIKRELKMNITRRQLRKLIYEVLQEDKNNPIIPNSNKQVLDIPDRFRDKQHVEEWLKDSTEYDRDWETS